MLPHHPAGVRPPARDGWCAADPLGLAAFFFGPPFGIRQTAAPRRSQMRRMLPEDAPVRNGLLAALPPEELSRLRPRLQRAELPFDQSLYPADGVVEAVL